MILRLVGRGSTEPAMRDVTDRRHPAADLPACSWCGDDGFRRMTNDVVLCVSDFEYVELHRSENVW